MRGVTGGDQLGIGFNSGHGGISYSTVGYHHAYASVADAPNHANCGHNVYSNFNHRVPYATTETCGNLSGATDSHHCGHCGTYSGHQLEGCAIPKLRDYYTHMKTLLLDVTTWDLCLDSGGNIAVAQAPYQLAQDVACAIRTFLEEVWYNDTLGVDYFGQILGHTPPLAVLQALLVKAALTVPGVVSAQAVISSFSRSTRTVVGQVLFVDSNGKTGKVSL